MILMLLGVDNDRLESELNDMHAECVDLSNRLAEKEKELALAKETTLLTKDCEGCRGKASSKTPTKAPISVSIASESLTETNNLLQKVINDVATVATLIEERSVNQTVFVKARGLGYESDDEKTLIIKELKDKAEILDKALLASKSKNESLEEKIKILEDPEQTKLLYGEKAHKMYVSQAQKTQKGKGVLKILNPLDLEEGNMGM